MAAGLWSGAAVPPAASSAAWCRCAASRFLRTVPVRANILPRREGRRCAVTWSRGPQVSLWSSRGLYDQSLWFEHGRWDQSLCHYMDSGTAFFNHNI